MGCCYQHLISHLICNRRHSWALRPVDGGDCKQMLVRGVYSTIWYATTRMARSVINKHFLTFKSNCWARQAPHWFAAFEIMSVPHKQQGIEIAVLGCPVTSILWVDDDLSVIAVSCWSYVRSKMKTVCVVTVSSVFFKCFPPKTFATSKGVKIWFVFFSTLQFTVLIIIRFAIIIGVISIIIKVWKILNTRIRQGGS